jgi:hypothetical protein
MMPVCILVLVSYYSVIEYYKRRGEEGVEMLTLNEELSFSVLFSFSFLLFLSLLWPLFEGKTSIASPAGIGSGVAERLLGLAKDLLLDFLDKERGFKYFSSPIADFEVSVISTTGCSFGSICG